MKAFQIRSVVRMVLLILAIQQIAFGSSLLTEEVAYWNTTNLDFDYLGQIINDQVCYKNEKTISACYRGLETAVRTAASIQHKTFMLTALNPSDEPNYSGQIVAEFGALKVIGVKSNGKSGSLAAMKRRLQGRRKAIHSVLLKLQSQKNTAAAPSFSSVFSWVRTSLITQTSYENYIAGSAANSFLADYVDPHTHFEPIVKRMTNAKSDSKSFVGVGISIEVFQDSFVVINVYEAGPAAAAGVRVNDVIIAVDGKDIAGLSLDDMVDKIRGVAGTAIKLTVQRKGQKRTLTVTRARVTQKNVNSKIIDGNIGYVSLQSFVPQNSCDQLRSVLQDFARAGAKGVIFDLRANGGGAVNQAVCITGLFVGIGRVAAKERYLETDVEEPLVTESAQATALPVVTLINGGSASASEFVSGALQDYQRSIIVGERSYGKATVQEAKRFPSLKGVYYAKTIARFYQPSGRTNQLVGIQPDIQVSRVPNPTPDETEAFREEDFYNSLPAIGPAYTSPRPDYINKLQLCKSQNGVALGRFEKAQAGNNAVDYQLLVAEDVLRCMR